MPQTPAGCETERLKDARLAAVSADGLRLTALRGVACGDGFLYGTDAASLIGERMRCAHIPVLIGAKRLAGSAGIKNAPKAHTCESLLLKEGGAERRKIKWRLRHNFSKYAENENGPSA